MHKLCLLSLLLTAVAMTSGQRMGQRIRLFRPGSRGAARTVPFSSPQMSHMNQMNQLQFPMAAMDVDYNYIQPLPVFNSPMRFRMPTMGARFGRRIPDGEYRTAHGIATVDGSDVSMDSHW